MVDVDLEEKRRECSSLAEKCGYAAAAVTMIPLPLTEQVAVIPIHVGMIVGIGHLYGFELTKDTASELLGRIGGAVGLSLIGSALVTTVAKVVIPFVGGLITAPIMFASTLAIASVARTYFESGGRITETEIKKVYNKALRRAKRSYNPRKAKSSEAQELAREAASREESDVPLNLGSATPGTSAKAPMAVHDTPPSREEGDPFERLENLKSLLDKGLIDQSEYDEHKQRILGEL
jgi:uncharacterized protein (DUF697 family)